MDHGHEHSLVLHGPCPSGWTGEHARLAARRPGRHHLGLQLRGHRLGHGRRAAAPLRGDPVRRGRLPGGVPRPPTDRARGGRSSPWGCSCRWASSASCTSPWPPACRPAWPRWCSRPRSSSRSSSPPVSCASVPTRPQVVGVVLGSLGLARRGGRTGRPRHRSSRSALCLLGALSWGIGNVVSRASGVTGGLSLTVWSAVVVPVPLLRAVARARRPDSCRRGARVVLLAGRRVDARTPPGWPRWSATASSTACSAATRRRRSCRGCCSRRWSRWRRPGGCSVSSPTPGEAVGGAVLVVGVLVALRRPSSVAGDGGASLGDEAQQVHPVRRTGSLGVPLETTGAALHQP